LIAAPWNCHACSVVVPFDSCVKANFADLSASWSSPVYNRLHVILPIHAL